MLKYFIFHYLHLIISSNKLVKYPEKISFFLLINTLNTRTINTYNSQVNAYKIIA